jgi:phosphatidylglycerophosphatase A
MELSGSLEKRLPKLREKETDSRPVWSQFLATVCGIGYLPLAPGTWASLVATAVWYGVYQFGGGLAWMFHLGALAILLPLAVIVAERAARAMGERDPSAIVIDEIVGQSLPFLFVPAGPLWALAAFGLFRFFDILKPPPVRQCERLPGGFGIVLDDCAAGIYAGLALWLIHAAI